MPRPALNHHEVALLRKHYEDQKTVLELQLRVLDVLECLLYEPRHEFVVDEDETYCRRCRKTKYSSTPPGPCPNPEEDDDVAEG